MEVEFDPIKDADNIRKHGLSLADAGRLDLDQAEVFADSRKDYGEDRYRAFGRIDGRLHVLAFMIRDGRIRAISFRRGNRREEQRYD